MRKAFLVLTSLVVVGCSMTHVATQPKPVAAIKSVQEIVGPEKKDISVNSNKAQEKSLKYSKLAVFETQRPKSDEAIGGYTAALRGTLQVTEHCVVVITENRKVV